MKNSSGDKERRIYPRYFIDLPLEYRDMDNASLRGGIVVNASEGGFLIESPRDIAVGTELEIAVLYLKESELANFKVAAKIVWKKPHSKEDWKGYQYGLEYTQILDDDRRELNLLINGLYDLEDTLTIREVHAGREKEF